MNGKTIHISPELAEKVQRYCDEKGLEKIAIATRRLIRIGLETEEKRK